MPDGFIVGATLVGVLGLAAGPLVLPWPWKLRWIVTVEAANPIVAAAHLRHDVRLEQVVVIRADQGPAGLVIVVARDRSEHPCAGRELVGGPASAGDIAALEGWSHSRTPLLLVEEGHRTATLEGPHRAITGLREQGRDIAAHLL